MTYVRTPSIQPTRQEDSWAIVVAPRGLILLFILLSGCSELPGAREVAGEVSELRGGEPIAGAEITLVRRGWGRSEATGGVIWDKAYTNRTVTDAEGRFQLPLPGPIYLVGFGAGRLSLEAEGFQGLTGVVAGPGDRLSLRTIRDHPEGIPGGTALVGRYPDGRTFGWSFVENRPVTDPEPADLHLLEGTTQPPRVTLGAPEGGGLLFVPVDPDSMGTPADDQLLRYLDEPPDRPTSEAVELGAEPGLLFVRTREDRYAKLSWDPNRVNSAAGALPGLSEPAEEVVSLRFVYRPLPGAFLPFQPPLVPLRPGYAAAAAELAPDGSETSRWYRLELRDEEGGVVDQQTVRLDVDIPAGVQVTVPGWDVPWRYENLLLTLDQEGLPRLRFTVNGRGFAHHSSDEWVSRRLETRFPFNAYLPSGATRSYTLVVQEGGPS